MRNAPAGITTADIDDADDPIVVAPPPPPADAGPSLRAGSRDGAQHDGITASSRDGFVCLSSRQARILAFSWANSASVSTPLRFNSASLASSSADPVDPLEA